MFGRILIAQKLMLRKGRESMLYVGRIILSDRIWILDGPKLMGWHLVQHHIISAIWQKSKYKQMMGDWLVRQSDEGIRVLLQYN